MVSTAAAVVIAIVVLVLVAAIGWAAFTQLRARRLGVSFVHRTSIIILRAAHHSL